MTFDDPSPPEVKSPLRGGFNSEVPTITRWQLYEREPKPVAKPNLLRAFALHLNSFWQLVLQSWRAKPK